MTRHFDDWDAPLADRILRYLREEKADIEREIPKQKRRLRILYERLREVSEGIRELERKRSDVD